MTASRSCIWFAVVLIGSILPPPSPRQASSNVVTVESQPATNREERLGGGHDFIGLWGFGRLKQIQTIAKSVDLLLVV